MEGDFKLLTRNIMSEILKMYIKYSVNAVQKQVSIYIPFYLCLGVISELYK